MLKAQVAALTEQLRIAQEKADEATALQARLDAAQTAAEHRRIERRALDREVVELRSILEESERQLANVRQTFIYRIGEAIVSARSLKGILRLPGRLLGLRRAYRDKKRNDGRPSGEERIAARLRYVDEAMRLLARDGLPAAVAYLEALPPRFNVAQARAMVEVAQAVRVEQPHEAGKLGVQAARLNPREMRLRALTLNLYEDGEVACPAAIIQAAPEIFAQPSDRKRRDAILGVARQLEEPFKAPVGTATASGRAVVAISARSIPHAAEPDTWRLQSVLDAARTLDRPVAWITGPGFRHRAGHEGELTEDISGLTAIRLPAIAVDAARLHLYIADVADLIEAQLMRLKPEVVHVSAGDLGLAAAALTAARAVGCRFVLDVGALPGQRERVVPGWVRTERHAAANALFGELVREADAVVVRSHTLSHRLSATFGRTDLTLVDDQLPIGALGIDATAAATLRRDLDLEGRTVVGMIEPLDGDEGLADAVRALPELLKTVPDAALLLCGSGPGGHTLRLLAAQLGVADALVMPTGFARLKPTDYLAVCDLALFPKHRAEDALDAPFTLQIAMASGTPVVAADIAWARERIEDGVTGMLAPIGAPAMLAEAMSRILTNRPAGEQMSKIAAQRIRSLTAPDAALDRIASLFETRAKRTAA